MQSVLLTDAWNSMTMNDGMGVPPTIPAESPVVSSKQARVDVHQELPKTNDDIDQLKRSELIFNHLLIEVRQLRHEQARRCSLYIILTSVLFGMLFVYLDRLHARIRNIALHGSRTVYSGELAHRGAGSCMW